MTIRRFCDACGTEIQQNYVSDRLTAERTFVRRDVWTKRTKVQVECMVTVNGVTNQGDLCRDCVIDTVVSADTRPTNGQ